LVILIQQEIVRVGDFTPGEGWGDSGVGYFWGGVTFQGLIPYYYDALHPGQSVELSRCVYNNMNDNPITEVEVHSGGKSKEKVKMCTTGQPVGECEDCRIRPLEDIVSAHYTGSCMKPWTCRRNNLPSDESCYKLAREWFSVRSELEQSWNRTGNLDLDNYYDRYCSGKTPRKYIPIEEPYGVSAR